MIALQRSTVAKPASWKSPKAFPLARPHPSLSVFPVKKRSGTARAVAGTPSLSISDVDQFLRPDVHRDSHECGSVTAAPSFKIVDPEVHRMVMEPANVRPCRAEALAARKNPSFTMSRTLPEGRRKRTDRSLASNFFESKTTPAGPRARQRADKQPILGGGTKNRYGFWWSRPGSNR